MIFRKITSCLLIAGSSLITYCGRSQSLLLDTTNLPPKYEMRGVWVSTVVNLDWPSRKGLSVAQQKQEFIRIATEQKALGTNALFVQVRPAGDAFYPSQYDPWSEYLTGKQGQAPVPFYDPLLFMIQETHKLGMEFHAWINPYRMVFDINRSSVADNHVTKQHPEWFVTYGKQKIFNPGIPEAVKYITGVVSDIVNRYDVDGIHMDDYFYPYPEHGAFHDEAAYQKYGNGLSLADWRRSNCNNLIKSIHEALLRNSAMVKFGISPFGIYQNRTTATPDGSNTSGSQAYSDLYADVLLWLKEGWIDYVTPQLYWEIGNRRADFATLVNWWSQHTYGKHLYIGEGIYRADESPSAAWRDRNEFPRHLQLDRGFQGKVQGQVLFTSKNILNNPNGWADSLSENYYRKPAIVPPMSWINDVAPDAPETWAEIKNGNLVVNSSLAKSKNEEELKGYVYYFSVNPASIGSSPDYIAAETNNFSSYAVSLSMVPAGCNQFYIGVTTLDRDNNESGMSNMIICTRISSNNWKIKMGY
ncbi:MULTISPECIES: glycoside hydrolase family 10 protein [Chitinophagaceae]